MLEAAIDRFGALITIAAAIGNVVAAGFLLWAFQRAFLAPSQASSQATMEPVTRPERLLIGALMLILLLAGFYSEPWMGLIEGPTTALGEVFGAGQHGNEGIMNHE